LFPIADLHPDQRRAQAVPSLLDSARGRTSATRDDTARAVISVVAAVPALTAGTLRSHCISALHDSSSVRFDPGGIWAIRARARVRPLSTVGERSWLANVLDVLRADVPNEGDRISRKVLWLFLRKYRAGSR
jgi:hypothetical protein